MAIGECPECKKPVSTGASTCPHCGYKPRGCLAKGFVGLLGVIIIIAAMVVIGSLSGNNKPAPAPPKTAAQKEAAEACRQKLEKARQLEVLHDLDWKPGTMPKVIVGPTFAQLPFETKEAFAQTVNCFLLGGEGGAITFDLKEHLNHHVVGTWEYGRLKTKE